VEREVIVSLDDHCSLYNGIGRNLLNKFLSLHILTINGVINLPTVSSRFYLYCWSGARSWVSRKSGAAVSGRCRKNDWAGGRGALTINQSRHHFMMHYPGLAPR